MTVRVKDLDADGEVIEDEEEAQPRSSGAFAAAAALLFFGVLGWVAGGKYTAEGWIIWLNWFLAWVGIPARVPPLQGAGFILAALIAYAYSEIEVRHKPARRIGRRWKLSPLPIVAIWALIVATDVGSTYQGVSTPARDAWQITKQIAREPMLAGLWSIILTFFPEWLILGGIRTLRGK